MDTLPVECNKFEVGSEVKLADLYKIKDVVFLVSDVHLVSDNNGISSSEYGTLRFKGLYKDSAYESVLDKYDDILLINIHGGTHCGLLRF